MAKKVTIPETKGTETNTPATVKRGKVCPISRAQFRAKAVPVNIDIANQKTFANVKEYESGSLGWYLNGKVMLEVDGVPCECQVGMNITIIKSKELPKD